MTSKQRGTIEENAGSVYSGSFQLGKRGELEIFIKSEPKMKKS